MANEHHRHHGRQPRRQGFEIARFENGAYNLGIIPDAYALLTQDLVWVDIRPDLEEYERIRPGSRVRYNGNLVRTVEEVQPYETLDELLTPDNLRLFDGYGLTREELIGGIRNLGMREDKGFLLFIHKRLEKQR